MTLNLSLRLVVLVLAAPVISACSEIDCAQPMRYHGSKLAKPVVAPEGLSPLATRDTHVIPGGAAPDDYASGACLIKPPKLVEDPPEKD